MKTVFLIFFISSALFIQAQALKGGYWLLESVDDIESGKSKVMEEKTKLSLQFDSDSTYSGFGCNNYKGVYHSDGTRSLAMQKATSIMKENCLGLGALEKEVLLLFEKAKRYRMDEEKLFIFTADDHRLVFRKL